MPRCTSQRWPTKRPACWAPSRSRRPGPSYRAALAWMTSFGELVKVGVEGTGSYGAGLARYLTGQGVEVAEVIRPNRQGRRRRGKSDAADAVAARAGRPQRRRVRDAEGPRRGGRGRSGCCGSPAESLGRRSDQFRQGVSSSWATGVCGECAPLHCRLCTARGRGLVRAGDGSHRGPPSARSVAAGDSTGSPVAEHRSHGSLVSVVAVMVAVHLGPGEVAWGHMPRSGRWRTCATGSRADS